MNKGNKFSAFMMVLCLSAIIYGIQLLFSLDGMAPGLKHSICLLIYGPLCFVLNALFLNKERTVNLTVLLNGIFAAFVLAIMFVQFGTGGGKQGAATIGCCLLLTYYAVRLNLNSPKETQLILFLDISVVLMILLAVVMNSTDRSFLDAFPMVVGTLCALGGLMGFRLHRLRDWLVPCGLLMGIVLVFGLMVFLAKPIGLLLTMVFGGVVSGLRYIGSQIERFLLYLTTFMKNETFEEVNAEPFGIPSGAMETAQQFQDGMGIIIGLIILAFFVFVLIMALKIMGKTGIGGKKIIARKVSVVQTPPFLSAFRNWFSDMKEKLHYSVLVIKHKNTPWGLYYMLRFAAGKSVKKEGETPREFLVNLSDRLPETGKTLRQIIPEIEKALFSRELSHVLLTDPGKILWETIKTVRFK